MKKVLVAFVLLFVSQGFYAQVIISSFLEKHGKDEGLELTNIGRRMFEMMEKESVDSPQFMKIISELDNISIITSSDTTLVEEYYDSASSLLDKNKDFTSFFAKDGEESLRVMIRQNKEVVKELVIIFKGPSVFNLISFTGNISLDNLMDYTKVIEL